MSPGSGKPSASASAREPRLHAAAALGDANLIADALNSGQEVNSIFQGVTALHAAASCGDEASVKLLLARGANVNAVCTDSTSAGIGVATAPSTQDNPGAPGSTPLHFATANGHMNAARILLQHGARPIVFDNAQISPELLAIAHGHHEVADLLRAWVRSYTADGLAKVSPGTSDSRTFSTDASVLPHSPTPTPLQEMSSFDQLATGV